MPIQITSLDQLDEEVVAQLYEEASQMMRELHPEVELASGPFRSLVLYFSSAFSGVNQTNVDLLRKSMSLKEIDADPTLADEAIVDSVLSNHLVTRKTGTAAAGEMTIVVSQNAPVVISDGAAFVGNSRTYRTSGVYVGRPAGSLVNSNDRMLTDLGDGTYSFSIPLIDDTVGDAGNIRRGTRLVPVATPENFVRAVAGTDFAGGFDTELNAELTAKLREGIAAKSMGGQLNWAALIKAQPAFERTLHHSIIGYGDPEQHRDQHSIFPGSMGGRVDIYSQTSLLPQSIRVRVEATLMDIVADGSVWQFAIDSDVAPGFYEVARILPLDAGPDDAGYEVLHDYRGMDLDREQFIPDIITATEAAYTRFQTAVIQFTDTDRAVGGLTIGDTDEYDVDLLTMPQLADLQDFCGGRTTRPRACDVLVRAAIPCFTTVSFDIHVKTGDETPDTAAIAAAIASAVNQLGFTGQLHASRIADIAHNFLTSRQATGRIEMFGRIRAPSGKLLYTRGTDILTIPDSTSEMVSGNTAIFVLDPQDIAIGIQVS